ncbi:hypothetical protein P9112_014648 [Eukaryota sp. TZLM1-RC]
MRVMQPSNLHARRASNMTHQRRTTTAHETTSSQNPPRIPHTKREVHPEPATQSLDKATIISNLLTLGETLRSASNQVCDLVNILSGLERAQAVVPVQHQVEEEEFSESESPIETQKVPQDYAGPEIDFHNDTSPIAVDESALKVLSASEREILEICVYGLVSSSKKGLTYNQLISVIRGRHSARGLFEDHHFTKVPDIENFPQDNPGPIGWGMIRYFINHNRVTRDIENCLAPLLEIEQAKGSIWIHNNRYVAFESQHAPPPHVMAHMKSAPPAPAPQQASSRPARTAGGSSDDEVRVLRQKATRAIRQLIAKKPDLSVNSLTEFLRGNTRRRKTIVDWGLNTDEIICLKNHLTKKACEEMVGEILAELDGVPEEDPLRVLSAVASSVRGPPSKRARI